MASDKIIELTAETFEETIQGDTPVLVDFWAAWCGPCRQVVPVLEELAEEKAGEVRIAKVDVDTYRDVAAKYGVMALPTFILFQNGEVVDQMRGAMPKSAFSSFLDRHLAVA